MYYSGTDKNSDPHALYKKLIKVSKYDQKFDQIRMADSQVKHFIVLESWIRDSENELHGKELKSILAKLKGVHLCCRFYLISFKCFFSGTTCILYQAPALSVFIFMVYTRIFNK